jgi:hypothetical protein
MDALEPRQELEAEQVAERYVAPDSMREVRAWLAGAGHDNCPLFRAISKSGVIGGPLDPGDVARVFKAMARAAGINPEMVAGISGHSSRVGAAQDQVRFGVELPYLLNRPVSRWVWYAVDVSTSALIQAVGDPAS